MARKWTFGTSTFGSLNTASSTNSLSSSELVVAENVSRDIAGEASPSLDDGAAVYSQEHAGKGLKALRYGGEGHVLSADVDSIYEDGVAIGTSGGDVTHRFASDSNRVYIMDGIQGKVWDGTTLRNHGAFQKALIEPTASGFAYWRTTNLHFAWSINAAANKDPCEINLTAAHGFTVGDHIRITSVNGMTELNDTDYIVGEILTTTSFSIQTIDGADVDATGYGAYAGDNSGIIHFPCGVDFSVKYYVTHVLVMPDGVEIESLPQQIPYAVLDGDNPPTYAGVAPAAATDQVYISLAKITDADLAAYSGDYAGFTKKVRIYRNKSGGTDLWLATELTGSDAYAATAETLQATDRSYGDAGLGALLVYDDTGTDAPPKADLAVFCQRRLFMAIKGEKTLYFSGIDRYDHFDPNDTVDCEESIEGLATFGEHVAVLSPSGIRLWSPVDEIGQWSNTSSSVGTTHSDGYFMTDRGLVFTRDDGAYLFDGVSSSRISEAIDPSWANGPWLAAYSNGRAYFTNGTLAIEFCIVNGNLQWSTATLPTHPYLYVSEDHTDGGIWGIDLDGDIYKLHSGPGHNIMTIKTKDYGDGEVRNWNRLVIDINGTLGVTVKTNRGSEQSFAPSNAGRQQTRYMLDAGTIGELANVEFTGTGTAHGVQLETT
jgi:hypothetical protein